MGETTTVTVRPGMHHKHHLGGELIEVTRGEIKAFGDKFIIPAIDATPEAWALGLRVEQMRFIQGSGKDGRILKSDVEEALGEPEP